MQVRKPVWWLLYALIPLLIGLLIIEHDLVLSLLGHELVQIGILVVVFGLMALWVRANEKGITTDATSESMQQVSHIAIYEAREGDRQVTTEGTGPVALTLKQARGSRGRQASSTERNN